MLAELLHKVAMGLEQEKEPTKYYPRPSLAGPERCIRQMVYFRLNFPHKPLPGRAVMIFSDSSLCEDLTGDWIRKTAISLHSEQMKVKCTWEGYNFPLTGKIDGILQDMSGNEYLYEHKAISHFNFQEAEKGNISLDYLTQYAIYSRGLWQDALKIDKGIILIRNRNIAQFLEFSLRYDFNIDTLFVENMISSTEGMKPIKIEKEYPNIVENAFVKFRSVEKYANRGVIPKRQYEMDSWQCFAPNTLVRMANGTLKEIQKIKQGEKVIAIDGATKVIKVGKTGKTHQWKLIKPIGLLDTICTLDHEWLVGIWSSRQKYYNNETGWFSIKTINEIEKLLEKGKIVAVLIPVHKPSMALSPLSPEECSFLGYYVTEGCLTNWQKNRYYRVEFTLGIKEENIAEQILYLGKKLFNCEGKKKIREDCRNDQKGWKSLCISFHSVKIVDFIRTHIKGNKAINKELSPSIMGSSLESIKAFLKSAERGDGSYNKKQNCQILSTSSRKLCNQYQQLYWRLGIPAIAQYASKPSIRFSKYIAHQGYRVQYQGKKGYGLRFIKMGETTYILARIKEIQSKEENLDTWDLEVESISHIFATESGFAKNCNYCQYNQTCWEGYVEEFQALVEGIDLTEELETLCAYYLETNMHKKEMEKEEAKLKEQIKQILAEKGVREGMAGKYIITNKLIETSRLEKNLIPEDILLKATIPSFMERLTINLRKEEKKEKKKKEEKER
ncbi:TPA: hypothetical protein DCX16_01430 [bacterium]|nr:hypothetical protein [bacterium]